MPRPDWKKGTRKFGKRRYVLKYDTKFLDTPYYTIKRKRQIAEYEALRLRESGWAIRITRYGDHFKVWGLPVK